MNHLARLENEKQFHNERIVHESRTHQEKYYVAIAKAQELFSQLTAYNSVGKNVLEIGCFHGSRAPEILATASSYTGIDISDIAIEKAAATHGASNCQFYVRDACDTAFPNATFDAVIACGIIHHLPLEKSLHEINRILKPGGKIIFFEPLGGNPLINLYRKLTPNARTPDETPLTCADIKTIEKIFPGQIKLFGLTTLLCVPLRNCKTLYSISYRLLHMLDTLLFQTPLRRWAWMAVIEGKRHA